MKNSKNSNVLDLREDSSEKKNLKKEDKPRKKLTKKQKIVILICVFAAIVAVGLWWYFIYAKNDEPENVVVEEPVREEGNKIESQLNGVMIDKEIAKTRPFAMMIENHPDSRPQSGLVDADVVYEALAEGGISRFLAIFQSKLSSEIGPVRSARTYYVDWAAEYEAIYGHAGGDEMGLRRVLEHGLRDLNGIAIGSRFFWRDDSRVAPHNLYTSNEKLSLAKRDEVDDWGNDEYPNNSIGHWKYEEGENSTEDQTITVNYSSDSYRVDWEYDKENNIYKRKLAGSEHKDKKTNEQIVASTVIVEKADTNLRDAQHLDIKTIGSGDGYLFKNGKTYEIRWEKDGAADRTRFFKKDSTEEITLVPGKIWIHVLPLDRTVDFTGEAQ